MAKWHPENLRVNSLYDVEYSMSDVLETWRGTFCGTSIRRKKFCLEFYILGAKSTKDIVWIPVAQIVNVVPVVNDKYED